MLLNFKDYKISENTQFAVLGLGKFGRSIVKVLAENNYNVLGCDIDKNVVHEVAHYATHVIQADVTDESVLDSIGLGNFDVVIVSMSHDFEASIITTMIAKEKKVPFVLAKANGIRQKKILESIGADWVILPEIEIGEKVAQLLISNNPMQLIDQSDLYEIAETKPKPHWVNHKLKDLDLIKKESIIILAILRSGDLMAIVDPDTKILEHDKLVILKLM